MVYSDYKLQRILYYNLLGFKAPTISCLLEEEGLRVSRVGIAKFLKKYQQTGSIARRPGSGRPSKNNHRDKSLGRAEDARGRRNTAVQLHAMLREHGYNISLWTVLRCRTSLGWTFRGSKYCQLIREVNKAKRLEWAWLYITESFDPTQVFSDVIWTDKFSVQLESHRRFCCSKRGGPPKNKQR